MAQRLPFAGQLKPGIMLRNHIAVALRAMTRHKGYTALNLAGLGVGLAAVFLIGLYVADERSYDAYHAHADRIYRLVSAQSDEDYEGLAKINGAWGIAAARELPEVEALTRFVFFSGQNFEVEGVRTPVERGFYADSTTFRVFSWPILQGDPETALLEPGSIVLTEGLAQALFPHGSALDEVIRVGGARDFRVTAIMRDVPENSHFRFRYLVSMSSYEHESRDDWAVWNQYYTYFLLRQGADPASVGPAVEALIAQHIPADQLARYSPVRSQPLKDIYLNSAMFREIAPVGNGRAVNILALVAGFVLLLASVNFVNLSTARASLRAREVGVRKSLGASRLSLIRQFLIEALASVFLASLIAGVLCIAALPVFNDLAGKSFEAGDFLSLRVLVTVLGLAVALGLVAGAYPAFVLSSFRPAAILRGLVAGKGGVGLRRALVVSQFVVSIALIMGTGIVSDQLDYIRFKPLGFEREGLVSIPIQDPALNPRLEQLKTDLLTVSGVSSAALSANAPGGGDWGIPIQIPGRTPEEVPPTRMILGDLDFARTYGFQVVSGRHLDRDHATDPERGALVNEELVRQMEWNDPIGQIVQIEGIGRELEVVGVLSDFQFRSAREAIAPLLVYVAPTSWMTVATVRVEAGQLDRALAGLQAVYERYDALNPFRYSFVDEQFEGMYQSEDRVGRLLNVATLLALLVACLGLFGLSAHASERRTREIGVRKALGASESGLVLLLTRETLALLGIAVLVATPVAVFAAMRWMDGFAFRSGISPATLAMGALLATGVALATAGINAWRAARLDPSSALRIE